MRKHSELEVFGIAYVDLMCLAFIGQIILWINQRESPPPRLRNVLVTIEQFGVAHFAADKDHLYFVVDENSNKFGLEVPKPAADNPNQVQGLLSGAETHVLSRMKVATSFSTGTDGGSAGSFTLSLAGLENQNLSVWIPFLGRECRVNNHLHQVHVTSISSSKSIWTAAFTFNCLYATATDQTDWQEVGTFLRTDNRNRGKTWKELLNSRLFIVSAGVKDNEMVLWLHLLLNRDGITSLMFVPVAQDLDIGEGTSIDQERLSTMEKQLRALEAQLATK